MGREQQTAAGDNRRGTAKIKGALKTLNYAFIADLRKEAVPRVFSVGGPGLRSNLALEASACLIEALSSAATTWDRLDAHEGAIQQEVCEGQCLRLTRRDIMHHYVCGQSDAHADLTDGRCCQNLPSPCWPKTNSSLSPFLPQPPSALLARVFEAKSGEGDN